MKRLSAILFGAILILASCSGYEEIESQKEVQGTSAVTISPENFEQGHIRIKLTPEGAAALAAGNTFVRTKAADALGSSLTIERTFPYAGKFEPRTHEAGLDRWYDVRFDKKTALTKAGSLFDSIEEVEIVEYRPKICKAYSPAEAVAIDVPSQTAVSYPFNDPMLSEQWHYFNDGSKPVSSKGCDINVIPVWEKKVVGNDQIIVAIVDGGVDYTHEDLAANMWTNPETAEKTYGYNFIDDNYNLSFDEHGTHVAGIVGAVNNNGKGVCGVAGGDSKNGVKGVKLMSCQIFDSTTRAGEGAVAIKWSADHGAIISQNSWGYTDIDYLPESDKEAIDYFNKFAGLDEHGAQVGPMAGGIVIFAASNEDDDYSIPAAYIGVMAVGALDAKYERAPYSCYGSWVDISAPGGDKTVSNLVISTLPDNKYGGFQGTSMACPHVSGAAALIISQCGGPGFTREALWNKLLNNATDISEYNPVKKMGRGLLNTYASVFSAPSGTPPNPVKDLTVTKVQSNSVSLTFSLPADKEDGKASGVHVYYSNSPITSCVGLPSETFPSTGIKVGEKMTVTVAGLAFNTKYYFACEAFDGAGATSTVSNCVSATTGTNHAPVIEAKDPLEFTMHAHETKVIHLHIYDPDGHNFFYYCEEGSRGETIDPPYTGESVTITIDGKKIPAGTYTGYLAVYDDYYSYDDIEYTYTVLENHAPRLDAPIDNQILGSPQSEAIIDLSKHFSDEDGETLKYSVTSSAPSIMHVAGRGDMLEITPLNYGYSTITVTATDGLGKTASCSFETLSRDPSNKVDIFPTSVTDGKINIRTPEDATLRVVITSSAGGVVYDETITTGPFNPKIIDISKLPAGVYNIRVENGNEIITSNIVKL